MKKLLILLFSAINLSLTFAQSQYLNPGQNAIIASSGYMSTYGKQGYNTQVGVSLEGIFDIGATYSNATLHEFAGYTDVGEKAISPYINVTVLKQDDIIIPVSILTGISYSFISMYDGAEETNLPLRAYEGRMSASIGINHAISMSRGSTVAPQLTFQYGRGNLKYESISAPNLESVNKAFSGEDNNEFRASQYNATIAVPFLIKAMGTNMILLEPSYSISKLDQQVNMKIGILFSRSKGRCRGGICPAF